METDIHTLVTTLLPVVQQSLYVGLMALGIVAGAVCVD